MTPTPEYQFNEVGATQQSNPSLPPPTTTTATKRPTGGEITEFARCAHLHLVRLWLRGARVCPIVAMLAPTCACMRTLRRMAVRIISSRRWTKDEVLLLSGAFKNNLGHEELRKANANGNAGQVPFIRLAHPNTLLLSLLESLQMYTFVRTRFVRKD